MQSEKKLPSPVKESLVALTCYPVWQQPACCLMCSFVCDDCKSQDLLWCSEKALRALSCIRLCFISSMVEGGFVWFVLFLNESQYSQVSI